MQNDKLKEALDKAELIDVRYTKLSGEAFETDDEEFVAEAAKQTATLIQTASDDGSDQDKTPNEYQRWRLMLSGGDGIFDVGIRLKAKTARSRLTVEVIAHYHLDYDLDELRDRDLREAVFEHAQRSAYPSVVPYIREAAEDLCRRLRVNPPYIKYNFSKTIEGVIPVDPPEIE